MLRIGKLSRAVTCVLAVCAGSALSAQAFAQGSTTSSDDNSSNQHQNQNQQHRLSPLAQKISDAAADGKSATEIVNSLKGSASPEQIVSAMIEANISPAEIVKALIASGMDSVAAAALVARIAPYAAEEIKQAASEADPKNATKISAAVDRATQTAAGPQQGGPGPGPNPVQNNSNGGGRSRR